MTKLDCTNCGACCVYGGSVAVQPDDKTPPHYTRSVRGRMGYSSSDWMNGIREMTTTSGRYDPNDIRIRINETGNTVDPSAWRCSAFRGDVGLRCRCACYARRPAVCAAFDAGGDACLEARRKAGMVTP